MTPGIVAVPYFGKLHRARAGLERIFFIVDYRPGNGLGDVRMEVWDDQREAVFSRWLKKRGIASLVCREDAEDRVLRKKIREDGIAVYTEKNPPAKKLLLELMV